MQRCSCCKLHLAQSNFSSTKAPRCKTCEKNAADKYKTESPLKFKTTSEKKRLKHEYGLDYNDYEKLVEAQHGVCKICEHEQPHGWNLAVDHDHTTGRIRGLLCNTCNRALGLFGDRPAIIDRASDYLKGFL